MCFYFGGEFLVILVTFLLNGAVIFWEKIDVDHSWVNKNVKLSWLHKSLMFLFSLYFITGFISFS